MKYTVSWLEKNLRVTRKALRNYEEKGLMDKTTLQNPDNNYREYSDKDIERIWCYRLLQSVGYSINDLVEMTQNADFDYQTSLSVRINDLERKKTEIEQYIGFAKAVKLTGSVPYPKDMGNITFDDFIKQARNYWNVNADPQMASLQGLVEISNKSEHSEADVQQIQVLMDGYGIDMEDMLDLQECYDALIKCKEFGVSDPVVQILANAIYEHYCEYLFPAEVGERMTPQEFARATIQIFTLGDIAVMNERNYGKDGCKFIAEALAYFGGFPSINDID